MQVTMKEKKSPGFDRSFDTSIQQRQMQQRLWKCSELLTQFANRIAPIDTGDLRQMITKRRMQNSIVVIWDVVYAGIRYEVNKKNPDTRFWIRKAYEQNRQKFLNIMRGD